MTNVEREAPIRDEETNRYTFPPVYGMEDVAPLLPDGFVKWPGGFLVQPQFRSNLCTKHPDPAKPPCDTLARNPFATLTGAPSEWPEHFCRATGEATTEHWAAPIAYQAALDVDELAIANWAHTWPLPVGRQALARAITGKLTDHWLYEYAAAWLRLFPAMPFAGDELAVFIVTGTVGANTVTGFGLITPFDDIWDVSRPRVKLTLNAMKFTVDGPDPSDKATQDVVGVLRAWWQPLAKTTKFPWRPQRSGYFSSEAEFRAKHEAALAELRCEGVHYPNAQLVADTMGIGRSTLFAECAKYGVKAGKPRPGSRTPSS